MRLFALLVFLVWGPSTAHAHPKAISSFDARTEGRSIDFAFRFDATSVVELLEHLHPDLDSLKKASIGEFEDELRVYFDENFKVFNDDRPCSHKAARRFGYNHKIDKLLWELRFNCPGDLGTLRLRSELFLSEKNPHQIIGNLRHVRAQERYFFTGGEREATITLADLYQQSGPLPALQTTFGPPPGVRLARPPSGAFDRKAAPTKADLPTRTPGIAPVGHEGAAGIVAASRPLPASEQAGPVGFARWLRDGFTHIFEGIDHLLFVLCLVIVVTSWRQLALVISTFTLAHSLTLAAGALELVVISPSIVEPAVALTILWVALENVFREEPKARARMTFVFGLVHGFAFSGVLRDTGMAGGELALPLLGFNLGVELGQLAFVFPLFPLVLWLQKEAERAKRARILVGMGVGVMAVYWFVERVFSL